MVELMTVQELADYLRVNIKTVYRMLEHNKIPSIRVGHQWRFDKNSIENWLTQSSKKQTAAILVIDDDPSICTIFKETLQAEGHNIETVQDPLDGLDLIKKQDFDLVFLDLRMPGVDGVEVFKEIRINKPELPVNIITGYPDSELMMRALANGPFGVMNKPFSSLDIINAVNNYLRFGMLTK